MDRAPFSAILLVFALGAPACSVITGKEGASRPGSLQHDLGSWHRPISTRSAEAQKLFDQGLTLAYAFNHDEAIRSFERAARLDPSSAMPWWGIALACGPHINNTSVPPERSRAAFEAVEKARALSSGATPPERDLIAALAHRYEAQPPADRRPLDEAYARAMLELRKKHPEDPDIGVLYAEALMDLQPWDFWTPAGKPRGRAPEIVATLEAVLARHPASPGANHLYIHAMEASPTPEKAFSAAEALRHMVPGAGHLVHMPAHIDLRLGRYAAASEANVRAIEADRRHAGRFPKAGFYRVYMAHNHHFLAFSSMMEGRSAAAMEAARAMVAGVPPEFLRESAAVIDGLYPIVLHVLVRFGRWEEVLREPPFAEGLMASNAIRHYARAAALGALGRLEEAEAERALLDRAAEGMDNRTIGNSPGRKVLEVARKMVAGELTFRRGRPEEGLRLLIEAAALEDGLNYDEPPDWMMPARQVLGASLLHLGRFAEAEAALREDLRRFPENGWSLLGLARALRGRGAEKEAQEAEDRFARAWSRADVAITSPCLCLPLR